MHTYPSHHTSSTTSEPPFHHPPLNLLPEIIIPPANNPQPMDTTTWDQDNNLDDMYVSNPEPPSDQSFLLLLLHPLPIPCLHLTLQRSFNVDQSCLPIFSKNIPLTIQVNMSGTTSTSSWLITFQIKTLLQHSNHLSRCSNQHGT